MEYVLIAAIVVVAATGLYVALTFNKRTRQTTAPLIDEAVTALREQLRVTADDLRGQLRAITEDLHRDRDEQRLDGRKIQGRLDHADSRMGSTTHQFLAELDAIKRRGEQLAAQQVQLSGSLRRLAQHVGAEPEPQAAVPGRLYVARLQFALTRAPAQSLPDRALPDRARPADRVAVLIERRVAELPPGQLGDLGDGLTAITRAESDPGIRDRLGQAASDYAAARWEDPGFAAITERWITRDTFPETTAAEMCDRIGNGVIALLAAPLEAIGAEIRLPPPAGADLSADLILQPETPQPVTPQPVALQLVALQPVTLQPGTGPVGQEVRLCEMAGVAAGAVTGLYPLALAAAKMLAHDEAHQVLARRISEAARAVFAGPRRPAPSDSPALSGSPAPPGQLEPATVPQQLHGRPDLR